MDIAKSLNAVALPLLVSKLEKFGVRELQLQLLETYVSNRNQHVKIDDVVS